MTPIEKIEREMDRANKRTNSLAEYSKEFKDYIVAEKSAQDAKTLKRLAWISTVAAIVSTIAAVIALFV